MGLVRTVVTLGIVFLTMDVVAQGADYFPLQVGNRWEYQCTNHILHEEPYFGFRPYVCDDNVQKLSVELTVSDTVRLEVASLPEPKWFNKDELPLSENGPLYYVLSGGITSVVFIDVYRFYGKRRPIDALLVRKGKATDQVSLASIPSVSQDNDFRNLIYSLDGIVWVGGILVEGRWLIYGLDRPLWLWDSAFSSYLWVAGFGPQGPVFTEEGLQYDSTDEWGNWLFCDCPYDNLQLRQIEVAAGVFPESRVVLVGSPEDLQYEIYFAPDVGIVQVGHSGFQLIEAYVNGIHYPGQPTDIEATSWGYIKEAK